MANININMDALKPKKEWKRFKLTEGTHTLRILPPFGEESQGYPYKKWFVVWGLNDPSTNKMRPFASPIADEDRCPVYEYLEALKAKAEARKEELTAKGLSKDAIKTEMADIYKVINSLRPRKTFAYNAIDKSGTVGILELTATAHKQLIALMHGYVQDYGQDPTSLNSSKDDSGVWFDFIRTGKGLDTEYTVKKAQTKKNIDGQLVFVDDREAISQNVVDNYDDAGYDVFSIYKKKSYSELKDILLFNIKDLVANEPFLAVPGFDDFSNIVSSESDQATNDDDPRSSDGEDFKAPGAAASNQVAQNQSSEVASASNDDLLSMADNILNQG